MESATVSKRATDHIGAKSCKADDKATSQLLRRLRLEEDGQEDEQNLAHALEDLKPVGAHLVTVGQLLESAGQRTTTLIVCCLQLHYAFLRLINFGLIFA